MGEPGGPHPHALPAAPGSPCPTTWQQPLRGQKLSGCDRCSFFFSCKAACWGGCAGAGSSQSLWEKAGCCISSSKAQPAHTVIPPHPRLASSEERGNSDG